MARDYKKLGKRRPKTVELPRWMVILAVAAFVLYVGLKILVSPSWVIQRLDSPDGKRSARLERTQYSKEHFVVRLNNGGWQWRTVFYSQPLSTDRRIDLGERIFWSEDAEQLFFRMEGEVIWGYDCKAMRPLRTLEKSVSPGG